MSSPGSIEEGMRVTISGLQARADLNGMECTAVAFDVDQARWKVRLDDGTGKLLLPSNLAAASLRRPALTLRPGLRVQITGLQARTELNGQQGELAAFDEEQERWKVLMDDGSRKMLRPVNLETSLDEDQPPGSIVVGSRVRVRGQSVASGLNGRWGEILRPAAMPGATEGGWEVRLDGDLGQPLLLRASDVESTIGAGQAQLRPGDRVRVVDLQAQRDLNGLTGELIEFDSVQGRWKVLLDDGGRKALWPANIALVPLSEAKPSVASEAVQIAKGARVRVRGLLARAEMNGLLGTAVEMDDLEDRWKVLMDDGTGKVFRIQNLEVAASSANQAEAVAEDNTAFPWGRFQAGQRVRICGLSARPDLNGQPGTLVQWDAGEQRWEVQFDSGGSTKLLQTEHIELHLGEEAGTTLPGGYPLSPPPATAAVVEMATLPPPPLSTGARVRIAGVKSRPELNGQLGVAVDWDATEERWRVRMDDGTGKFLRPSSLELVAAPTEAGVLQSSPSKGSEEPRPSTSASSAALAGVLEPKSRIRVKGLTARPDLNGLRGELVEWSEMEGRWKVRMDDGTGKMLRPEHLELESEPGVASSGGEAMQPSGTAPAEEKRSMFLKPGMRVQVVGLQARADLNGSLGRLLDWDEDQIRWKVLMDDGSGKMFRPSNLEAAAEAPGAGPPEAGASSDMRVGGFEPPPGLSVMAAPLAPAPVVEDANGAAEIRPGSLVRVRDLQAQAHLNGQCGRAVEWDAAEGRWKVRMQDGAGKLLKPVNLDVVASEQIKSSDEPLQVSATSSSAPAPEVGAEEEQELLTPGSAVLVRGIKAQPHLNGMFGTVVDWDAHEERWKVVMEDGSKKMLRPANLQLCSTETARAAGEAAQLAAAQAAQAASNTAAVSSTSTGKDNTISEGSQVRVFGIKAQPHLNGMMGIVIAWDHTEARWKVKMEDGSGKMLRSANMEVVSGREESNADLAKEAWSSALTANSPRTPQEEPHKMSLEEKIDFFNAAPQAVAEDGSTGTPRPSNMQPDDLGPTLLPENCLASARGTSGSITAGSRVRVSGIKAQPHLNGLVGTVVDWDQGEARWKVVMEDGAGKMLRPCNLELVSVSDLDGGVMEKEHASPSAVPSSKSLPRDSETQATLSPGVRVRVHGVKAQPHLNGMRATLVEWDDGESRWKLVMEDGSKKMLRPMNLKVDGPEPLESTRASEDTQTTCEAICTGQRVRVRGIKAQPHLNGMLGTVVEWDKAEGRWKVIMENGSKKMLRPCNVVPCSSGVDSEPAACFSYLGADTSGANPVVSVEESSSTADFRPPMTDQAPHSSPRTAASGGILHPGSQVRVCNIVAQPHLNGMLARVVEWDESEGRYKLVMEDGAKKMLRPINLQPCASEDDAANMPRPANLQPCASEVASHTTAGAAANVAEPNCFLYSPGDRVRIVGIETQPHLNGQEGRIVAWDDDEMRWKVMMDSGTGKLLRPEHVEAIAAGGDGAKGNVANIPGESGASPDTRGDDVLAAAGTSEPGAATGAATITSPGSLVRVFGIKAQPHLNGMLGTVVEWEQAEGRWKVAMEDGTGKMLRPANLQATALSNSFPEEANAAGPQLDASVSKLGRSEDSSLSSPTAATGSIQPGSTVRVTDIKAQPHLNGMRGTVSEWDEGEGRWKVVMEDGSGKMLRTANLLLASTGPSETNQAHDDAQATEPGRSIEPGTQVLVSGIKAQPHLNGMSGTVVAWDESEERWKVIMQDGSKKMLRSANLQKLGDASAPSPPPAAPIAEETLPSAGPPPPPQPSVGLALPSAGPPRIISPDTGASVLRSQPSAASEVGGGSGGNIAPGARVRIFGLQARPELNGKHGTVVDWDESEERWKVVLEDGSGKMLRSTHLEALGPSEADSKQSPSGGSDKASTSAERSQGQCLKPGAHVRLCGLEADTGLNGQEGVVEELDTVASLWRVSMVDGSAKLFRPCNLEVIPGPTPFLLQRANRTLSQAAGGQVQEGMRVRVCGLKARPELNGLAGTAVGFVEEEERWRVLMEDGSRKMFRAVNLEPHPGGDGSGEGVPSATASLQGTAAPRLPQETPRSVSFGTPSTPAPTTMVSGARVRVHSLRAQLELNGELGTLVEWDDGQGRWKVRMDSGAGKLLKEANLEVLDTFADAVRQAHSVVSSVPSPEPAAPQKVFSPPSRTSDAAVSLPSDATFGVGQLVRVVKLQARQDLNGSRGRVVDWAESEGRWKVQMEDGTGKMFRPDNLESVEDVGRPQGQGQSDSKERCESLDFTEFDTEQRQDSDFKPFDRVRVCGLQGRPDLNGVAGTIMDWDGQEQRWRVRMDDGSGKMFRPHNLSLVNEGPKY